MVTGEPGLAKAVAQGGQGRWQQWEGALTHQAAGKASLGSAKASLLLQEHSSASQESCVSSQGKASGKTDVMAHKRLFGNQKSLTQTCHCHSTSPAKARALHFKEAKSLNNHTLTQG